MLLVCPSQYNILCSRCTISLALISGYGMTTDGVTKFINAATCNKKLDPCNQPIIFDIELPTGFTKDDVTSMSMVNEGATAISTY